MSNFLDNLGQLVLQYPSWSYAILGLAILIQGELTILLAIFLIINKSIGWTGFLIVAPATLFVAENILYFISRALRNTRFGWRLYKKLKPSRKIQFYLYYLKTNLTKLLIVSRFLVATNFVIFILVGWSKTKFGKFLKSYLLSMLLWFVAMTAVAYFLISGLTYLKSEKIFRQIEIGIVVIVVLIFGGEFLLRKVLKRAAAIEEKAGRFGEILSLIQKEDEIESPENKERENPADFFSG